MPLGVIALWRSFYYLNFINTRRARYIREQTYRRISLWRNMSCSSLYHIQLRTLQTCIALQEAIHHKMPFLRRCITVFSLRNAVVRSTSCGAPNYLTHTNTKARNMLLNKPTVGSVWEGVCYGLIYTNLDITTRLHRATRDDLHNVTKNDSINTQSMLYLTYK